MFELVDCEWIERSYKANLVQINSQPFNSSVAVNPFEQSPQTKPLETSNNTPVKMC